MSFPHWRLILNGKSAGNPAVREAVHALRGRGIMLDVRVTWEKGDAERFVAEALAAGITRFINKPLFSSSIALAQGRARSSTGVFRRRKMRRHSSGKIPLSCPSWTYM